MKVRISAYQLFSSIILVPYGSAILFLITPKAKQDAWIAMLLYIIPGVILQLVYTSLWSKYPQDTIVTYMPKIFGKFLGYVLGALYTVFFAYEAARVLRDSIALISISIMPKLSLTLSSVIFMVVIGYAAYLGFENLSRAAHLFLPMLIFFFIMLWIFLVTTPYALKLYNLQPVLENGIAPVIKEGWKLITFPYGESILFTMFFPSVVETSKVRKAAVMAIIAQGILLSINTILFISVLGVDFASNSLFPLLQTIRMIKIGETFDRLDIFIVLIMVIGAFIKVSFFMYGAMLGTAQLIKSKEVKYWAVPFSISIMIASILIAKNYPQHIYIGQVITLTYIHLPLAVIIPIIALIVYHLKNQGKTAKGK